MPESIIQPEKDLSTEMVAQSNSPMPEKRQATFFEASPIIIWTPTFIALFILLLVTLLSGASLLTMGAVNGYYPSEWPEMIYMGIVAGCWISVLFFARSAWIRLGSVFSLIWALFMGLTFLIALLVPRDQTYTIVAHITAVKNSALLASYFCFSLAYTAFRRWDAWFFRLVLIVGALGIVIVYYFSPPQMHSLRGLEDAASGVALVLCAATWWLRPSCWKAQPGPTFLFGLLSLVALTFYIPVPFANGQPLFFTLLILIVATLGALRIWQQELQNVESKSSVQNPM